MGERWCRGGGIGSSLVEANATEVVEEQMDEWAFFFADSFHFNFTRSYQNKCSKYRNIEKGFHQLQ